MHIVPADGLSEEDISRILHILEHKLDSQLALTIQLGENIPLLASGRVIYILIREFNLRY